MQNRKEVDQSQQRYFTSTYWSRCANERDSNYYPVRSRIGEADGTKYAYYIGSNLYDDVPRKNVIDWEKGKDEGYENTSNQAVIVALDALAQEDEESEASKRQREKSRGLRKKGQKQQSTASRLDANEKMKIIRRKATRHRQILIPMTNGTRTCPTTRQMVS